MYKTITIKMEVEINIPATSKDEKITWPEQLAAREVKPVLDPNNKHGLEVVDWIITGVESDRSEFETEYEHYIRTRK